MSDSTQQQNAPWLANKEWAAGLIHSKSGKAILFWWFFTVLWLLLSAPATIEGLPQKLDRGDYGEAIAIGIFPLVGICLFLFCCYVTLRWFIYRESALQLTNVPAVIGGKARYELLAPESLRSFKTLDFQLGCYRKRITGSGKNRHVSKVLLWMDEISVAHHHSRNDGRHTRIPVVFTVPFDCQSTDTSNHRDQVYWTLTASSAMTGIDYSAEFMVPVFKTEQSDPAVTGAIDSAGAGSWEQPPPLDGIQMNPGRNGGMSLKLPALRFAGAALKAFVFAMIWFAVSLFAHVKGAPTWMVVIFYAVGFLILLLVLHWLLVQSELKVERGRVHIKRSWLGLGPVTVFQTQHLKEVRVSTGASSSSDMGKDRAHYLIDFILTDNTKLSLGEVSQNNEEVDYLASVIKGWTERYRY